MFKETYPAAAFNDAGKHVGPGPWLKVIHETNRLAEAEGLDGLFDRPTYDPADTKGAVEIYRDATVTHDLPTPDLPPLPDDSWSREFEMVARERERIRDAKTRDPRNTVTITSKTPLGERLLTAAHAAVKGDLNAHPA